MARRGGGYSPRPWREVVNTDEPIVIDSDVVAAFLERAGRPRMADYVRDFGNLMKRQHFMHDKLREDYTRVLAKLHVYEPPAPVYEPHNPVPPPEASD